MLENSKDAIVREMQEEIGARVNVHRLLWVVENFFEYNARSFHELNQSQGGMCICRVLGIGAGVSRECFGP